MYRTSKDRRFRKNKEALRKAFIELVIESGYTHLTVSALTARADVDRMTFYSHYDSIDDIFQEFVDDMEAAISAEIAKEDTFSIDRLFAVLNSLMYKEIEFFRYVAGSGNCGDFRDAFKDTIGRLIQLDMGKVGDLTSSQQLILSDLAAVCIAYSYLDWLAGDYGDVSLDEVIDITKDLLSAHLPWVVYR